MHGISRRRVLATIGSATLTGAAIAAIGDVPHANAQVRPFTWAGTGGTWGDALNRVFVEPFAKAQGLNTVHSAQLEAIAASKIMASCASVLVCACLPPQ